VLNIDTSKAVPDLDPLVTAVAEISAKLPAIDLDPLVAAVVDIGSKWRTDKKELPAIIKRDWEQIEESIAVYNDHAAKMAKVIVELSGKGSADISKLDSRIIYRLSLSHFTCPGIDEDGTYDTQNCFFKCPLRLFASETELTNHRELAYAAKNELYEKANKRVRRGQVIPEKKEQVNTLTKKRKTIESPLPDSECPLPDFDIADK
jgi:hypothetical protein